MALEQKKIAIVYLGAKSFPKSENFTESGAFSTAKNRIFDYFNDEIKVSLENVLDLFDSELSADDQDNRIGNFILKQTQNGVQDLFIYYVGHGGFTPRDEAFYLAIKSTRDNNPGVSSITIRTLANTVTSMAKSIRTFVILDCCFSGSAGLEFQSSGNDIATQHFKNAFNTNGVALLCASSKDLPALIVNERNITMFTEGLDTALRKGDTSINEKYLSLRQIYNLTNIFIKEKNIDNAVRPELFSPLQNQGDISDLPHFINFGYQDSRFDILAKKREIEDAMIKNNYTRLGNSFIDFVRNFDQTGIYNMESILLCSDCNDLEEQRNSIDREDQKIKRKELYNNIMVILMKLLNQLPLSN